MFVLEVIPFSRTAPSAPLSYRSLNAIPIGTLISVPLRKKTVTGLVVGSMPVQEAKAELKTASFSLSKSSNVVLGTLPAALLEAAQKCAVYHATSLGAVLSSLIMPVLPHEPLVNSWEARSKKSSLVAEYIEAPFIERNISYEKILRESVGATLLVVPTQAEADEWAAIYKAYKPIVLSGRVTGERRETALARASETKPVTFKTSPSETARIIISTPSLAWALIPDLGHIIIERVSGGSYVLPKRPYIDVRVALTELARVRGIPITYGDYPLPLEYRKNPEAKVSSTSSGRIELLDVRSTATTKAKGLSEWHAVPELLRTEIKKTTDAGGRAAILAIRRGYSPTVVCRDCGTAVTDAHGQALSLATIKGVRVFRSTDGKVSESAEVFCKVCGGWNLQPLGIGIERVEEELREVFKDTPIVRIDQDTRNVLSLKKARSELLKPGTIIIGTELMLPFLSPYEPVDLGIIASADSLLALPFWRARERFMRVGKMLAERSQRTIIASRHPEDTAITALTDPNDTTFWKEETGLRKILSYPPFGTLIVFHIEGSTAARLEEARVTIRAACLPHVPLELPDRADGTNLRSSLVLQLPLHLWPDANLSNRLANLPPSIRIHIDSEMLW